MTRAEQATRVRRAGAVFRHGAVAAVTRPADPRAPYSAVVHTAACTSARDVTPPEAHAPWAGEARLERLDTARAVRAALTDDMLRLAPEVVRLTSGWLIWRWCDNCLV